MPTNFLSDSLHAVTDTLQSSNNSDSGWILHHIIDELDPVSTGLQGASIRNMD